jgi:hypothetical protein
MNVPSHIVSRMAPMRDPHQASDADWFWVYETCKARSGNSVAAFVKAAINSWLPTPSDDAVY